MIHRRRMPALRRFLVARRARERSAGLSVFVGHARLSLTPVPTWIGAAR
jgi:hypothetical protein